MFLYIVIKKSCWTVTYSFESGLNFICGDSEWEGGIMFWKLDCFFVFFMEKNKSTNLQNDSDLSAYLFSSSLCSNTGIV